MYATQMPHHSTNNNHPNLRLYQTWRGNNIFCLGGRLIFGPDARSLYLTMFLIVTPVIFFCFFVSQNLVAEFPDYIGYLITAACAALTIYVVLLLFMTSARDPGIMPRNARSLEDESSSISADLLGIHGSSRGLSSRKDVMLNGIAIRVKYCKTCMLYRPPRCSHCSLCNNCVERFDHHCPWLGQCIGKRNYRFFFMFVSSTTMLCLYVFAFCWVNIRKIMDRHYCNLWRAFLMSPASAVLILFSFVCGWFVGGLTSFHLYLIFTNQTTYENFRYRYDGKINPYNQGCVGNVVEIFFSKIPRSKNQFREKVNVDLSSLSATAMPKDLASSTETQKPSLETEAGKRQAVVDENFEDIRSQMDSVIGSHRNRSKPRNAN